MADLPIAANIAQIASLVIPMIVGGFGMWRRMEKKQTEFELHQNRISDKLDFIQAQFGPNGGGIRQAVNEMSKKLDKVDDRTNNMSKELGELSGRFNQHIIENDK